MPEEIFITIIGAGVVGCAIAYEVSRDFPDKNIVVIERNPRVAGENQSSRNSGVIHAGIFYPRELNPLKARLCVEGNSLLYDFCSIHKIPHSKCGKLVVAVDELELEYLEDVLRISKENNVPGVTLLDSKSIKNLEPNIKGLRGLWVPTSGIIESTSLVNALYRISEGSGAIYLTGTEACGISPLGENGFQVKTKSVTGEEIFQSRIVINSAGLYSDEVAFMVNPEANYQVEPIKGDTAKFYSAKRQDISLAGHNVYPVPMGYFPDGERLNASFSTFLELLRQYKVVKSVGTHLTPVFEIGAPSDYKMGNTYSIGPAYSAPRDKEDYTPGREERYFLDAVRPFFPGLKLEDISLHQTGIRAKLKNFHDFIIEQDSSYPQFINLVGIDSPGLTSCLAIARHVKKILSALSLS